MFEHSYYTCEHIIIICTSIWVYAVLSLQPYIGQTHCVCETESSGSDIDALLSMDEHTDCRIRSCWCIYTQVDYFTQQHFLQYSSPMTVDYLD